MTTNKIIECPFCKTEIIAKFILSKDSMSRFYAYCIGCKCSIMKTIKRGEEFIFKNES